MFMAAIKSRQKCLFEEPEREIAKFVNRSKRSIIVPNIYENGLGNLYFVNVKYVEYKSEHDNRLDILMMIDKGFTYLLKNYKKSKYYKFQRDRKSRSQLYTIKKVIRYYKLFRSIKNHGFIVDKNRPESFPWLFAAHNFTVRLDGHHRVSVATFLGYKDIPVLLITPNDILKLPQLPPDAYSFFSKLSEPDFPGTRPYV